jgi:hypothetical protein
MLCFAPRSGRNEARGDGDVASYTVGRGVVPRTVETVANHRVVNQRHILAAVSGGVTADPRSVVQAESIDLDRKGSLNSEHSRSKPMNGSRAGWWWD